MAKFKRFDASNRKATNHDKFRKDYSETHNDYIKRKAEYDEERYYYSDSEDSDNGKSKIFQPQRNGVRL